MLSSLVVQQDDLMTIYENLEDKYSAMSHFRVELDFQATWGVRRNGKRDGWVAFLW